MWDRVIRPSQPLRGWEARIIWHLFYWIPAFAGMTKGTGVTNLLDPQPKGAEYDGRRGTGSYKDTFLSLEPIYNPHYSQD